MFTHILTGPDFFLQYSLQLVAEFVRERGAVECEEATGHDREDPLDGRIFEDIVGEAGDYERHHEESDECRHVAEAVARGEAAYPEHREDECEEREHENGEADHSAVDIEFDEIIVRFV